MIDDDDDDDDDGGGGGGGIMVRTPKLQSAAPAPKHRAEGAVINFRRHDGIASVGSKGRAPS